MGPDEFAKLRAEIERLRESERMYRFSAEISGRLVWSTDPEGNVLAIEPMFNLGGDDVYTAEDDWTVITKDHLPSAHFEHTVVVTKGEPEILTRLPL